ncbi:MAG: hypothetical protein GDA46_01460 [Bdellovibrionales bacterium]|nr:hypothetical protein [Bdellovibrionales bacterium]
MDEVNRLINQGVDYYWSPDVRGMRPVDIAVEQKCYEIVNILGPLLEQFRLECHENLPNYGRYICDKF